MHFLPSHKALLPPLHYRPTDRRFHRMAIYPHHYPSRRIDIDMRDQDQTLALIVNYRRELTIHMPRAVIVCETVTIRH